MKHHEEKNQSINLRMHAEMLMCYDALILYSFFPGQRAGKQISYSAINLKKLMKKLTTTEIYLSVISVHQQCQKHFSSIPEFFLIQLLPSSNDFSGFL